MHVLPLLSVSFHFSPTKRNLPMNIHVNQQFAQLLKGTSTRWFIDSLTHNNIQFNQPSYNQTVQKHKPTWCPTACKFLFGARLVNYPDDVREEATEYNSNRQHRQDGARERNNWGEQNKTENKTEQNREQSNWDRIAQLGKQKQGSSQAKYKLLLLFFLLLLVLLL